MQERCIPFKIMYAQPWVNNKYLVTLSLQVDIICAPPFLSLPFRSLFYTVVSDGSIQMFHLVTNKITSTVLQQLLID